MVDPHCILAVVLIQQPLSHLARVLDQVHIIGLGEEKDVPNTEPQSDMTKTLRQLSDAKSHVGELFLGEESRLCVAIMTGWSATLFVCRLCLRETLSAGCPTSLSMFLFK